MGLSRCDLLTRHVLVAGGRLVFLPLSRLLGVLSVLLADLQVPELLLSSSLKLQLQLISHRLHALCPGVLWLMNPYRPPLAKNSSISAVHPSRPRPRPAARRAPSRRRPTCPRRAAANRCRHCYMYTTSGLKLRNGWLPCLLQFHERVQNVNFHFYMTFSFGTNSVGAYRKCTERSGLHLCPPNLGTFPIQLGQICGIAVHEKSDVVPLATNTTNRRVEVGACWPALICPSGPALPGQ
jgi:hypothetical protein